MKRGLWSLAVLASVLMAASPARANFVIGTQAFSSTATTSSPIANNVNQDNFSFNFATLLGGANQTGDYIGTVGAFTNSLDTTSTATLDAFSFGSSVYGTFAVTGVLQNSLLSNVSRTVQLAGTFSPNAGTFGPGFVPTNGTLTITINEATMGGQSVLSGSATLATFQPSITTPGPSTLVMLLTGCAPALGWVFTRRRRQSAQV